MKMKNKEEEFYVEIEDSVELRREMLETSKELIGILQQYEEIKAIDTQKVQEIEHLRNMFKEISADIMRLKGMMPKIKLSSLPRKETFIRTQKYRAPEAEPAPEQLEQQGGEDQQPEAPEKPAAAPATDTNKLESDLNEIEKKLQELQQ
jgi:hypothetical protein